MAAALWAIALVMLATLVGGFGPILLKKASRRRLSSIKSLLTNSYLIVGVCLYGIATVLFIAALRGGDVSTLYPFVSITFIWVSLLSVKILKEKMTFLKWAGIALIMLGVSMIGLGS